MENNNSEACVFQYEKHILAALTKLYQCDSSLFKGHTHEQTYTFRIAHYLAEQLEKPGQPLRVDCEYHRDRFRHDGRKTVTIDGNTARFRPDIIFHDRGHVNTFCLEFKINSPNGDIRKVSQIIEQYGYPEGYCVCNFGSRFATVYSIKQNKCVKRRYCYDRIKMQLCLHNEETVNLKEIG